MKAAAKKQLRAWFSALEEMGEAASALADEMTEALEAKSDKWREGDKGQEAESEADAVRSFADYLENARDQIADHVNE